VDGEPAKDPQSSVTIALEEPRDGDQQETDPVERSIGTVYVDQPRKSPSESEESVAGDQGDDPAAQPDPSAAEPVQTAAIPASPATANYTHWIRLGTFRRPESAPILWRRLQRDQGDLLRGLSYQIAEVREGERDAL
jgi:hypothetical protein